MEKTIMTNIFLFVLAGSVSVGLITVVLLAWTPFLNKRYAAKWKYWIWLFLAVRLLLPFSGTQVRIALQALQQEKTQQTAQTQQNNMPMPPRAPAQEERIPTVTVTAHSSTAAVRSFMSRVYVFADFIICIIVATLFEWNGVYSCFSLRS